MADIGILDVASVPDVVVPIIKASELKLGSEIGRGAFGAVYKGTCRGKEVVVKILEGIEWSDDVKNEFLSEISIMAQLLHGNIVLCMGAVTDLPNFGYGIVLEYMARGTLHKILHDPEAKLSLPRLIQFGIDTCQGMAWLHGQKIWHRDLKPENVLVDSNWVAKVADFGLSEVHRQRQVLRDNDDAPGSVLWMAPEVLLAQDVTSKLDVYSFSLVFWEILTRKDLFTQYTDRDIFTEDIARQGKRPPIEDIHPILQKILVRSWDRKPEVRPSFEELIDLLRKALVDIFLPTTVCKNAGAWWSKNFPGKAKVAFKSFTDAFTKYFNKKLNIVEINCLLAILTEETGGEVLVDIERFANVLKWFGPMELDKTTTFVDRIKTVMSQKWFFGDIDTPLAQRKVESFPAGTFLVRLNLGGSAKVEEAPYTITTATGNGGSFHTRCYKRQDRAGFIVQIKKAGETTSTKKKTKSNLIEDLIRDLVKDSDFDSVCNANTVIAGQPYQHIFDGAIEIGPYNIAPSGS